MKKQFKLLLVFCIPIFCNHLMAQCENTVFIDSSFETNTLYGFNGEPATGFWFQNDGCEISTGSFIGDFSACSNGGGAFQFIAVDSHTNYFISAYILNGNNETAPYPLFSINWQSHSFSVPTENWTFVSHSFNSGSDTLIPIGFYSMSACFDEFRITCHPLTGTTPIIENNKQYILQPNISSSHFELIAETPIKVEIWDVNGHLINKRTPNTRHIFGEKLPKGMSLLKIEYENEIWIEKIIKL